MRSRPGTPKIAYSADAQGGDLKSYDVDDHCPVAHCAGLDDLHPTSLKQVACGGGRSACPTRSQTLRKGLPRGWNSTHVVHALVKKHIAEIRQALGDTPDEPLFIETIGHRGYRFVASARSSNVP